MYFKIKDESIFKIGERVIDVDTGMLREITDICYCQRLHHNNNVFLYEFNNTGIYHKIKVLSKNDIESRWMKTNSVYVKWIKEGHAIVQISRYIYLPFLNDSKDEYEIISE